MALIHTYISKYVYWLGKNASYYKSPPTPKVNPTQVISQEQVPMPLLKHMTHTLSTLTCAMWSSIPRLYITQLMSRMWCNLGKTRCYPPRHMLLGTLVGIVYAPTTKYPQRMGHIFILNCQFGTSTTTPQTLAVVGCSRYNTPILTMRYHLLRLEEYKTSEMY